jgi:hypothetical protein
VTKDERIAALERRVAVLEQQVRYMPLTNPYSPPPSWPTISHPDVTTPWPSIISTTGWTSPLYISGARVD